MTTIIIRGNFTIEGVDALNSVQQPLEYLELETMISSRFRPVTVVAKKK